jgi:class 3 adenylate cyclase/YHS domain-containing protein
VEREVTIVFADLAGFAALTEAHGDQDAVDVAARFFGLARRCLAEGAALVKTMGDAVMIAGASVPAGIVTALRLAIAVNDELFYPMLRVGLHAGPAAEREGDYFGATVNLAARIAAHARSGQILCSATVATAARSLAAARVAALGPVCFKHIPYPVELFELSPLQPSSSPCVDPVCRMAIELHDGRPSATYGGETYHFCSDACAAKFLADPATYVGE